jgi:hypothetical protein
MSEAVTPTKPISKDEPAEIPEPADAETDEVTESTKGSLDSPNGNTSPTPAPSPKKPIGTKEVPAFAWKLVGLSSGVRVTLFKAVEHADVEAQLGRLTRDGYYTELEILDIDAKVTQPKSAAPKKSSARKTAKAKAKPTPKAARKKTSGTTSKTAKARKKTAPARKVKTAPKRSAKTATKAKKKTKAKTAARKSRKK